MTVARDIWPHLAKEKVEPQAQRQTTSPQAKAIYPHLVPAKPPRRQLSWDELYELDPERVEMVLRRKGRR
jgi:hypothetical protein